jgi:hypothetical protein
MIFSQEQVAQVRAGRITATLTTATRRPPKPNTTQILWRRWRVTDDDDNTIGWDSGMVYDQVRDPITATTLQIPAKITIQAVQKKVIVDKLTDLDAHACGYKTTQGLQDAWLAKHPRTPLVHIIRFAIGDVRDRDQFMQYGGLAGGDYTMSPSRALDRDAPIVPRSDLELYAKQNTERYAKQRKDKVLIARDELISTLEKLELGDAPSAGVAAAIRSLRKQVAVLDRRLKAA